MEKNNRQQIEFLESTDLLEKFTRFLKTNEGNSKKDYRLTISTL